MFSNDPCSLNYSVVHSVRKNWTTSNWWNILLWFFLPQLFATSCDSAVLNYPEHMKCTPIILVPSITRQFVQFDCIELSCTHEIFSNDPCSFNYSVVKAVWLKLNCLKLMKYFSMIFSQLLASSSNSTELNYINLMKHFPVILVSLITR